MSQARGHRKRVVSGSRRWLGWLRPLGPPGRWGHWRQRVPTGYSARAIPSLPRANRRLGSLGALLPLLALFVCACRSSAASEPVACRFLQEHVIRRSPHLAFDGVALAAIEVDGRPHALAVWSEPSGWYLRRLAVDGSSAGTQQRLGDRCRGGVAVAADRRGVELLCSRTAAGQGTAGALVHRSAAPSFSLGPEVQLAALGSLSVGLSAVVQGRFLWVGYSDADPDAQAAMVAQVVRADPARPPNWKRISRVGHAAGAPSLLVHGDAPPWAAFSEVFLDGGRVQAELRAARGLTKARSIMAVRSAEAAPRLVFAFGRTYMVYRDRPSAAPPGLFAVTLGPSARPDREPVRLARADGEAVPALCSCEQGLFTATPRVYAGDYFIGVNRLSAGLSRLAPEQQFYEDSRAFFQVVATCAGDRLLLLVAERAQPGQPGAVLRTVPVTCRPRGALHDFIGSAVGRSRPRA